MIGFEPGSSGIGSNRAANCATTTALINFFMNFGTFFYPTKVLLLKLLLYPLYRDKIRLISQ